MGVKPDSLCYGSVLNACAYTLIFLKCCDRFLLPGDDTTETLVTAVFSRCCSEGMVSVRVVKELEGAVQVG